MIFTSRQFYLFSGYHSLLIGLLPFFLPILLWESGASLSIISGFIALTAVSFIATLWCWDRLRYSGMWRSIILLSFLLEMLMVIVLTVAEGLLTFACLAWLNGAYSCFYWSTHRVMFSEATSQENTGKTFGNMQIIVVVLLKLGIIAGAYLLENQGMSAIVLSSAAIASLALLNLISINHWNLRSATSEKQTRPLTINNVKSFNDSNNSKFIFLLDGPFLFLESYFWILSLYLISGSSYLTLGIIVVSLTALLSMLFFFIKNRIDQANSQRIFAGAVLLYALSWLLRGNIDIGGSGVALYAMVLVIAFMTTFFRLAFNKRFFDIAKSYTSHEYIILKSYYSQFGIAVCFGIASLLFAFVISADSKQLLTAMYWLACPIALAYGVYAHRLFSTLSLSPSSTRHSVDDNATGEDWAGHNNRAINRSLQLQDSR
ncbi:hypothetical protein [Alkalimarinus coralli]|uniref:hypothetical protein n=1 Tax=Alkalimarinus coralli TaxID=2935863 RepID=UPI00202AD14E|nr:hypothetical protein [Alkalimarinus coralli]